MAKKRVLVIGSGSRESAMVWKLAQTPGTELFAAPGNAGIAELATCVPIEATDIKGLVAFAKENAIDLTIAGPEAPLVLGIGDAFGKEELAFCGPSETAAQAEGSKAWFKHFLKRNALPTGAYEVFTSIEPAVAYVRKCGAGNIVIKADGLAAGKGVILPANEAEAIETLAQFLLEGKFNGAGKTVVIEERLSGVERSAIAMTDGETVVPFPFTQDYKRIGTGDVGPNTGGMGTHTVDLSEADAEALQGLLYKTVEAFKAENIPYRGFIYLGIMMTENGPSILECNTRLGDPETEVIFPSMDGDFVALCEAVARGTLAELPEPNQIGESLTVALAAAEYPDSVTSDVPITGIEEARKLGALVFHGNTVVKNGVLMTNKAGRVLNVVGTGKTLKEAHAVAYAAAKVIHFDGMQYRTDIGAKYL